MASLGELLDENIGHVEVTLRSKSQAEQFYQGLGKAISVYELKIGLDWGNTQHDFRKMCDTLATTKVGVLELDLGGYDGPIMDILNRSQRYDPMLDIMQLSSIQSFAIRGPRAFSTRSGILSRNDFSNLEISPHQLQDDISSAIYSISKASNLSSLAVETGELKDDIGLALQVCHAIAEHWAYPIHFKNWHVTIAPPSVPRGSDPSIAVHQCMEHLLGPYYEATDRKLYVEKLDEFTADAIAKATTDESAFTQLVLEQRGHLSDSLIIHLSSIVAQSELTNIVLWMGDTDVRVWILEMIQWPHLRYLEIYPTPRDLGDERDESLGRWRAENVGQGRIGFVYLLV